MSDFDDDPRLPDAFDRLRSDAEELDAMTPLSAVRTHGRRVSKLAFGVAGGAVIAILVIVGIAVFGGDEPEEDLFAGTPGQVTSIGDLPGSSWELISGTSPLGEIEIIEGHVPTLEFGDGSMSGSDSCHRYGAEVEIVASFDTRGSIAIERDQFQKASECLTEGVSESAGAYKAALDDVTELALADGRLELSGPSSLLVLRQLFPDEGPPRPLTGTETDLDDVPLFGTTWELVGGTGPTGPITPSPGARITLVFDGSSFGGNGGCNDYGAGVTIDGDRVAVGDIEQTLEGCEPPVGDPEADYLFALGLVTRIDVSGDLLTLTGDEATLRFQRSVADPVAPHLLTRERLEGTSWTLVDSWEPPSGAEPVPLVDGWPITLFFDGDTIGGTAACNGYGGRFELDSAAVMFLDMAWTEAGCEPDVQTSEQAYLDLLVNVEGGRFDGDRLILSSELGELFFARESASALDAIVDRTWVLESATSADETYEAESALYGLQIGSDGTLTVALPCRRLDGEYVVSGTTIVPTSFGVTEQPCRAMLRQPAEIAFSVVESGFRPEILDGKLVMTAAGGESLTWVEGEMPPTPDGPAGLSLADLNGTTWRLLEGLVGDIELSGDDDIRLSFDGSIATAGSACNSFRPNVAVAGGQIEFFDAPASAGCGDPVETFLTALVETTTVSIFPGVDPRVLELFGPGIQLNFEEVERGSTEMLTVNELLDLRPDGVVTIDGTIISYGGTTIVCGAEEVRGDTPPRCLGRWVTVTNYNSLVDGDGPLTGVLRDDGRFQIVGPGSGVAERGSGVDLTDLDERLVELFVGGEAPGSILDRERAFFAPDGVTLWLGSQVEMTQPTAELADPTAWVFDEENFNGYSGPFSVLDTLENFANRDQGLPATGVTTTAGPHDHCASQPLLLPESLQGLRQVSIQPTGIDSCLQWFAIDLFLDDGQIAAVMLDLWEP